jgi:hypothetical protein
MTSWVARITWITDAASISEVHVDDHIFVEFADIRTCQLMHVRAIELPDRAAAHVVNEAAADEPDCATGFVVDVVVHDVKSSDQGPLLGAGPPWSLSTSAGLVGRTSDVGGATVVPPDTCESCALPRDDAEADSLGVERGDSHSTVRPDIGTSCG